MTHLCAQCQRPVSAPVYYTTPEIKALLKAYPTDLREFYCSAACSTARFEVFRKSADSGQNPS
ncbi:MAG: hypothetical protein ACPHAN_08385 [Pseudomonadales bacterium]